MTDPVCLRPYRAGDESGILSCYNRIFPTADGKIGERSLAHWRWKFRDNPTGQMQVVVAEHEEEGIVGGYSGIPVRVLAEGRVQLAAQTVDLMVLPKWRRHGPRPGLFVHLGWKYNELWCGAKEGKNVFCFGLAVPAWRMGQRYLGYWNIRGWDFLFLETGAAPVRAVAEGLEVRRVERFAADVDGLWGRLATGIELAVIRDSGYLNWRYADHPDHTYRLYECREIGGGELRGVCVYTVGDLMRPHTGFLVDWLAPADDEDTTAAMLGALEQQSRDDGSGVLAAVQNHVDPRFLRFQALGYRVMGTSYFIGLASFKYDSRYYREQWYFTMGDWDLI